MPVQVKMDFPSRKQSSHSQPQGPNNICWVTHHSLIFSLCPDVTFYKTLTSISTVFIKGHVEFVKFLNWPCRTSLFTHVEPYSYFRMYEVDKGMLSNMQIVPLHANKGLSPDLTCNMLQDLIFIFKITGNQLQLLIRKKKRIEKKIVIYIIQYYIVCSLLQNFCFQLAWDPMLHVLYGIENVKRLLLPQLCLFFQAHLFLIFSVTYGPQKS